MKKLLLSCLSLALLLCLLPLTANAATLDSGPCGENLTWTIDDTGTLTISGTGPMADWSDGSPVWCSWMPKIVIIEEGVTTIGERAFVDCASLSSITIPEGVTTIEKKAFYDCDSLTSITIPASVTSIGEDAFGRCDNLKEVHITDLAAWCSADIASTPNEFNLYLNGALVTELTIPDGVTTIGAHAFYDCASLSSVTIPESVTTIGDWAFRGCTGLSSVTIPESVTTIGAHAFSSCTALKEITLPESLFSIGDDAFKDAPLKTVHYGGTKEQWEKIDLNNNAVFSSVNVEFSSAASGSGLFSGASSGNTGFWVTIVMLSLALAASVALNVILLKKKKA